MCIQHNGESHGFPRLCNWLIPKKCALRLLVRNCRVHQNLPFWDFGTKTAVLFVLGSQLGDSLLVAASFEHLICSLLVECAAHALIGRLHGKNGCTTEPFPLPDTVPHHSWKVEYQKGKSVDIYCKWTYLPKSSCPMVVMLRISKHGSWEYHSNSKILW